MLIRLSHILLPLQRRPLLCLALFWAAGILLAVRLAIPWAAWIIAALIFLLAWLLVHASPTGVGKVALGLSVLCLSAGFCGWRLAPPSPGDVRYLPPGSLIIRGYAQAPPTVSLSGTWRVPFRVTGQRNGAEWRAVDVDVLLTGNDHPPQLGAGYRVQGKTVLADEPGDPFAFNWQAYLAQHGMAYRLRANEVTFLHIPAPTPWLHNLRAACGLVLIRRMPDVLYAQLLESLVLGVYGSPLPDEVIEQFRRAGTIHLMVVSGSQVTLLGFIFLYPLAFRPLGWARTSYPRLRLALLLLSLPVLALFVTLADRGPSVDRALYIVLLTVLALFLALSPLARQRSYQPDGLTLLAAAGLIMLIGQPALLFNPGMQLSFAAVFGVITITPVLMRLWSRVPSFITLPIAATLGAQLMTYPVLAWHFGSISLLAPLTNLVAVPVAGLLLPLGLLTLAFSTGVPWLAYLFSSLCVPLLDLLLFVNKLAAHCAWGQLLYYVRSPWLVLGYFAILYLGTKNLLYSVNRNLQGWDVPAGREPRMW